MSRPAPDPDGYCEECGVRYTLHSFTVSHYKTTDILLVRCPDLSLPQPDQDDDPWEEPPVQSTVSDLFDSYDALEEGLVCSHCGGVGHTIGAHF